jgi:hypothetical protein
MIGIDSSATSTSPDITAISDGALPLYGTLLRLMPVATLSTSVATCPFAPAIATLNLPGSFLAAAINSLNEFGPIFGLATKAVPAEMS